MRHRRLFVVAAMAFAFVSTQAAARPQAKNQKQQFYTVECFRDCGDTYANAKVRTTKPRKAAKAARKSREITRAAQAEGSGLIRSKKTGATARVAAKYRGKFQAYINAIEAEGGAVHYMGGIRQGRCSIPVSKHPCGMALDVCQDSRGRVSGVKNCRLPKPARLAQIAARFGLIEGGVWCSSDYGHAEIRTSRQAEGCGRNLYAAMARFKQQRAGGS